MKKSFRRPSHWALRFTLALLVPASGAAAATFTVTNLADSGPGSLRQAVLDANAAAGADEVAFAPGLTGTITLTSAEIAISDSLFVHGPGAGALAVSGDGLFRVFHVERAGDSTPLDVTLSGLTLTRGRSFAASGGTVFANGENLTILDSIIASGRAEFTQDPPIFICGGNVALFGLGGGSGQTLRIVNSLLTGGVALGISSAGGGNLCVVGARLVLERSTLSAGFADNGGGLYAESLAAGSSIVLSTIADNAASAAGGGIATASSGAPGELTIRSSTISGNDVTVSGSGGGISTSGHDLQIVDSTVSGNGGGDTGGGIAGQGGRLEITNSTVSTNHARLGGGLFFTGSAADNLLLRLTTVADNTADAHGGSLLAVTATADGVRLDHAILAHGTPEDLAGAGATPATLPADYSLIEDPGTTVVSGTHNLIGVDPLLGPLADNGGPTLTHQLLPGSPALDAGNPAFPGPPATDQRGSARIVGPAIDLGAVEGLGFVTIPALSPLGLVALCALLLAAAARRLRRV